MNKLILRSILIIAAVSMITVGSTSAYFSDTKVISGNVFSTGTWNTPKARLVINEVYYIGNKEWIELYNAGDATADIKGWAICNNAGDCGKLEPEKKTDVAPNGFVLVSHDKADLKGWDVSKDITTINYAGGKIDFKDTGDSVILKDTSNNNIDEMSYTNNATLGKESLARIPDGTDTNNVSDFSIKAVPTPGFSNN